MKNRYLLKTIKQEKLLDRFKEYKEMTREEIEDLLSSGDTNEFSWGFAIYLLNILDKAIEFIKDNADYDEDINRCCDDLRDDDCDELLEILK